MGTPIKHSSNSRRRNGTMRLFVTTFIGVVFGFFLGVTFPTISLTKLPLPTNLFPSFDLPDMDEKSSGLSTQALLNVLNSLKDRIGNSHKNNGPRIWVPSNPRGAEMLPPGIIESESDLYTRRLWGLPSEDLIIKPRYLVTFTVGLKQKKNIDAAVKMVVPKSI